MEFERIQCCSSSIFSYLNLHELFKMNQCIWNKSIQESIRYLIVKSKTEHIMYKVIISKVCALNEIKQCAILFFIDHYLNQKKYSNFKIFLFGMFDTKLKGTKCPNYFYLATRQYRLFFIYRIDESTILILIQINDQSVFYNILKRDLHEHTYTDTQNAIPLTGYLIKNKNKLRDNTFITSLFSPSIYGTFV
jgi:hypothetical protein